VLGPLKLLRADSEKIDDLRWVTLSNHQAKGASRVSAIPSLYNQPVSTLDAHLAHHPPNRKTGEEAFHLDGRSVGLALREFWQWSASDLISNATRGRLAEYIIASALGLGSGVRSEWDAFDLLMPSGLRIEVKSCAYLQSWKQTRLSPIVFSTPKTRSWDAGTGVMEKEAKRQADLYIFALLSHSTSKQTLDPLDLDQWHFYPVSTSLLNERTRSQHSITLKSLQKLCPDPKRYKDLAEAVRHFEMQRRASGN